MRRFEAPYLADWLATSLRWLMLVALSISLALRGQLSTALVWVLGLMLVWNVVLSALAVLSIRMGRYHRHVVLGVDFLLSAVFFWLQGGLAGASAWVGLVPILTGAIYFETWGAFGAAGLFALWQFLVSPDSFTNGLDLFAYSGLALTLLIGIASGLGGRFVMRHLRVERQTRLDLEERRRRM